MMPKITLVPDNQLEIFYERALDNYKKRYNVSNPAMLDVEGLEAPLHKASYCAVHNASTQRSTLFSGIINSKGYLQVNFVRSGPYKQVQPKPRPRRLSKI